MRNEKKILKANEEVKESKFSFMGRKFRELGIIGKGKTTDREVLKKSDKYGNKKHTESNTTDIQIEQTVFETNEVESNDGNSDSVYESPLESVRHHEETYGTVFCKTELIPPRDIGSLTTSVKKTKIKNPNLKLSDCPPLVEEDLVAPAVPPYLFFGEETRLEDVDSLPDEDVADDWEDIGTDEDETQMETLRQQ